MRLARSPYAPWAGLFVGAVAWFTHHQAGSNFTYWDCRASGGWLTVGLGLVALLVTAGAGFVSWRACETPPDSQDGSNTRNFGGWVSAGSAALFAFAILLQMLTGLIVPGCFR